MVLDGPAVAIPGSREGWEGAGSQAGMRVPHLGAGYVAVFNQGKFAKLVTYDLWAFSVDLFPYMYMCI